MRIHRFLNIARKSYQARPASFGAIVRGLCLFTSLLMIIRSQELWPLLIYMTTVPLSADVITAMVKSNIAGLTAGLMGMVATATMLKLGIDRVRENQTLSDPLNTRITAIIALPVIGQFLGMALELCHAASCHIKYGYVYDVASQLVSKIKNDNRPSTIPDGDNLLLTDADIARVVSKLDLENCTIDVFPRQEILDVSGGRFHQVAKYSSLTNSLQFFRCDSGFDATLRPAGDRYQLIFTVERGVNALAEGQSVAIIADAAQGKTTEAVHYAHYDPADNCVHHTIILGKDEQPINPIIVGTKLWQARAIRGNTNPDRQRAVAH